MNKLILFILVAFVYSNANAVPMFFPAKKPGAGLNYTDKAVCEIEEGAECFRVDSCPADECSLENVQGKEVMVMNEQKMQGKIDAANAKKAEKDLIAASLEKCLALAPTTAESRECQRVLIRRLYPDIGK